MKKRLSALFLSALIMMSFAFAAVPQVSAKGVTADGLVYETMSGEVIITDYTGNETEVLIPSSIDGNTVTGIDESAFAWKDIESVTIPSSVTSIGDTVFKGCENLEVITVDEGNSVFDSRDNCNAVIRTDTNTLIAGCKGTEIPETVEIIGENAFYYVPLTDTLWIPSAVVTIEDMAFAGCTTLEKIVIPASVEKIGLGILTFCDSLETVEVDADNRYYDSRGGCNAIIETSTGMLVAGCGSTVIPQGVTAIESYAFWCLDSLADIDIPSSVTIIGRSVFASCEKLERVSLPAGITTIGDSTFWGCTSLESIYIPKSTTLIEYSAFEGCENLTDVYYEGSESDWEIITMGEGNEVLKDATVHFESYTPETYEEPVESTAPSVNSHTQENTDSKNETSDKSEKDEDKPSGNVLLGLTAIGLILLVLVVVWVIIIKKIRKA